VTALDGNRFVCSDRVRDTASVAGGCNDDDIVLAGKHVHECFDAGRVDAVVVGN
jgi:hypothetical protein